MYVKEVVKKDWANKRRRERQRDSQVIKSRRKRRKSVITWCTQWCLRRDATSKIKIEQFSNPPKTASQNKAEKADFGESKNPRSPCSNLSGRKLLKMSGREKERGEERVKIEKKQTHKTASNFDRCCFGEWSHTLKRTEATWQARVVFLSL